MSLEDGTRPKPLSQPVSALLVRDARQTDLADIVGIYNEAIASRLATAQLETVTVASQRPWLEAHNSEAHPLWVAEIEGTVAGWLSAKEFLPRCAYAGTVEISLYVGEKFRRRRIGQQLLREAITRAPILGIHTLVGLIFAQNEPSLALFAKADFERWGFLPAVARVEGERRDLVIVGRSVA